MARLNTTKPAKPDQSQPRNRVHRLTERNAFARREFRDSATPPRTDESNNEQWTARRSETTTKDWPTESTEKPLQGRSRLQRSRTVSDLNFDIFADSDGMSERGGATPSKGKTATPLKLARTNSLLLPRTGSVLQPPRSRTNRKSELYNYDKENDPLEEELDPDEPPSLSRNPSDASSSSTRQSPTRNGNPPQYASYRQPDPTPDSESSEGDSFNSLEDFIVSDNEELSYHETPDTETREEEEQIPASPSPPRHRRRLVRGRRPNPTAELIKALQRPSQKEDLRLEPSLPTAIAIPSPVPKEKLGRPFQEDMNASERTSVLDMEDNDPSSQLQQDLYAISLELQSPSQKSRPERPIFQTPPSSPSKGRLRSPTKEKLHIPPTPYRESVDAFWSQEATADWIEQHSPRKLETLLQEFEESDCEGGSSDTMGGRLRSRKEVKTPSKKALKRAELEEKRAAQARKKSFDSRKVALAEDFFRVLDDAVSGGKVQKRSKETGGVRIIWSKTLQTTAGRANWKQVKISGESSTSDLETTSTPLPKHHCVIELAERIIDNEDRLINTLAHEYCHLANYVISNVHNNPHGTSFKLWGRKCKEALKDHPVYGGRIEVTTKHSYKIDYKYVWSCVDCGQNYGRHSKSIDTSKSRCGKCQGLLQQIKPKPRNVSPRKKPQDGQLNEVVKVLEEVSLYD